MLTVRGRAGVLATRLAGAVDAGSGVTLMFTLYMQAVRGLSRCRPGSDWYLRTSRWPQTRRTPQSAKAPYPMSW